MTGTAVTATDLVVAYGAQIAIDTSTFTIPSGTVTAIIGPNGSGKTTTIRMILRIIQQASTRTPVSTELFPCEPETP